MYIKKILLALLALGLIGMAFFAYYVYDAVFVPNTKFNNDVATLFIRSEDNFSDVKEMLEPLLIDMESFEAVAERKKYIGNVKAGKYIIKKGMTNNDIVNTLRVFNEPIRISFNNQERLENLAGRLSRQIEPDSVALVTAFKDEEFLNASGFNLNTAIGMYIPNSYEVFWNISAESFRDRMFKEYNNFWSGDRNEKAKAIGLTRDQVMSLAAIVQKETAKVDERKRVAGVYMNRINKKMRLEADPTVIYALKKKKNNFDLVIKRVLNKDLKINSPYNTYLNLGVPPGPIMMPDISSVDAVLNYERHEYIFFCADVQNFGYHKFAKTLVQHNRNAAEYRKWINNQGIRR
ncbi:MAG: endolytic transglycosylase MltG [Flavobacteriaceae bacterium]|nr:endolytic transglycosylase MltG [Flavobacteriaceae bacterium]